ncbi:hypothetical protein ACP4OV_029998 [Aristida adscensionis]
MLRVVDRLTRAGDLQRNMMLQPLCTRTTLHDYKFISEPDSSFKKCYPHIADKEITTYDSQDIFSNVNTRKVNYVPPKRPHLIGSHFSNDIDKQVKSALKAVFSKRKVLMSVFQM